MAKSEMSFAKKVDFVPVGKAREDLKSFNEARGQGEDYMSENREPFCGACMWQEYQKRKALRDFQKGQGQTVDSIEVPDWHEYAGKDKFRFIGKTERRNRREMTLDIQEDYECKKDAKHHVCLSESKPLAHPESVK